MANTKPQAVEVAAVAMLADDVAQTIMATVASAQLEAGSAWRQVEFVVGDQYLRDGDLEEIGLCGRGLTTAIQESGRDQQANGASKVKVPVRPKYFLFGKENALAASQGVNVPDAGIVAGVRIRGGLPRSRLSNRFRHGASYFAGCFFAAFFVVRLGSTYFRRVDSSNRLVVVVAQRR